MSEKMGFFVLKDEKLDKSISGLWPLIDLVAVIVTRGDRILTVYNEKWGAFTLPMSKLRRWRDPKVKEKAERVEDWEDAAVRAATEWVGRTTTDKPEYLREMAEFQQSDRDEKWKRYRTRAYRIELPAEVEPHPARVTEWLTAAEICDEHRRPLSPTARYIVRELHLTGHLG